MKVVMDDVTFGFESREVLKGVSLSITAREVTAVLGVSGCGKSTLIRLLAGLEEPEAGQITYEAGVRADQISRAIAFQDSTLFPWKTVRGNLDIAQGADSPSVEEIAHQVGLGDALDLFPHQLSGGMKQRAEFGRVLARRPEMLFLDEPFNRLDVQSRKSLQELFLRVHEVHCPTTILVTHDIREAVELAGSIKVMRGNPVSEVVDYQAKSLKERELVITEVESLLQAEFEARLA